MKEETLLILKYIISWADSSRYGLKMLLKVRKTDGAPCIFCPWFIERVVLICSSLYIERPRVLASCTGTLALLTLYTARSQLTELLHCYCCKSKWRKNFSLLGCLLEPRLNKRKKVHIFTMSILHSRFQWEWKCGFWVVKTIKWDEKNLPQFFFFMWKCKVWKVR